MEVFVKLAGLGLMLFAAFDLYYVIVKLLELPTSSSIPLYKDIQGFFTYLILGLIILFGARGIVWFAYCLDKPN
ncbi:MAG: hypothetical protein ACM3N5_13985 [Candidatus Eiseniibacteriota bacterium]